MNKLKTLAVALCCLVSPLLSGAQCAESFKEGPYIIRNKTGRVLSSVDTSCTLMDEAVAHAENQIWDVEKQKDNNGYYKILDFDKNISFEGVVINKDVNSNEYKIKDKDGRVLSPVTEGEKTIASMQKDSNREDQLWNFTLKKRRS